MTCGPGLLHTASVESRTEAETETQKPQLYHTALSVSTSDAGNFETSQGKVSEHPTFSPDLNPFPSLSTNVNLKRCPELPFLQVNYFLRIFKAMVYLEAYFR